MPLKTIVSFLKDKDELKTAEILLNTFAKYANGIEQLDELAMLYEKVKLYTQSEYYLQKCLAIASNPAQQYAVRANLAKVYNHLNEPQKSILQSNLLLELNPNNFEAQMEIAFSYYLLGEYEKSYALQTELLKNSKISENVKKRIFFNMGTFEMEAGDFKSGLYKMIMGGKEIGLWTPFKVPFPKWDGKHTDKTILVFAEGGIGDEIVNIRFCKEIEARGMKYVWVGHRKETNDIFKRNGFTVIDRNVNNLDPFTEYVYAEAMTLPIIMEIEKEKFWTGPYLKPSEEKLKEWKEYLPEKFITVKWSGNPYYDQDLHRTVDMDMLLKALNELNLPIVCLQMEDKYDYESLPIDYFNLIESWEDTLAIQYLAHENITSCTSTAHSAGAMGAKVKVLPPICTYYPWLGRREGNKSWWYSDNTSIYKQTKHKCWKQPIEEMINDCKLSIC